MLYQCTKDMLKALKIEKPEKPDTYNGLFAWNVKLMKLRRRNLVYLMNDATKLSIILYGVTAKEFKRFNYYVIDGIKKVLEDCGVANTIINLYLEQIGEACFSASGSKKQLGVLNWAAEDIEYFFEELSEDGLLQRKLSERQNNYLMRNDHGDYAIPRVITKNLLSRTYGSKAVQFNLAEIAGNMFWVDDYEDTVMFLDVRTGIICAAERDTEDFEELDSDDGNMIIRKEYFDFYYHFNRFAGGIPNEAFHQDLARWGHGKGAIRRIKDLMHDYPDILERWYEYKNNYEQGVAKEWLESLGVM